MYAQTKGENMQELQKQLEEILESCRSYTNMGRVADYIPELASANRDDIGICVSIPSESEYGGIWHAGDWEKQFTIQSICKPILLLQAIIDNGTDYVKEHVGMEATGKPFNAIDYSEHLLLREHINPMVNIGAIAVCGMIKADSDQERFEKILSMLKRITGDPDLAVDERVFNSERETGNKNRALAYLLKSSGMLSGDAESLLEVYFAMCSIKVSCRDLAAVALLLAMHGKDAEGRQVIPEDAARMLNSVLTTSGMYDGSGEFAATVGVPAKSGVGGGIMAVVPGRMGIGIYSPGLDKKGNSVAGVKMLERLSREMNLSIF